MVASDGHPDAPRVFTMKGVFATHPAIAGTIRTGNAVTSL